MKTAEMLKAPGVQVDMGSPGTSPAVSADQADWAFGLATPERRLFATGLARRLPPGPAATLGERVRRFFAETRPSGHPVSPRVLVGALPFDREAEDRLFLPERVSNTPWPLGEPDAPAPRAWRATPEPSRAAYEAAVARALEAIAASRDGDRPLDKVVLSRSLKLEADVPIDAFALWRALRADPAATRFITPLGRTGDGHMRRLIGASPELLASRRGDAVLSHPLAGSAPRSTDLSADEAAARSLSASAKDRREHAVVVAEIMDRLAPHCRELSAPPEPALVSTRTMWHLGTRIEGRLKAPEALSAAALAALLHPTPAVAGAPRDRAVELIGELEGYDRGFYAGAVGWTDESGDGAWYVSLRCAEVAGRCARLYAGAGVVEGSDPAAEAAETSAKLRAVLQALGVDETGQPLTAEPRS